MVSVATVSPPWFQILLERPIVVPAVLWVAPVPGLGSTISPLYSASPPGGHAFPELLISGLLASISLSHSFSPSNNFVSNSLN